VRENARLKAGFFPCPPQALDDALQHLRTGPDVRILDPCAGAGEAVKHLADGLGVAYQNVYAVELDAGRGDECRQNLPGATVLAPCSFHHTAISRGAFSLVYSNPPFDDALGGQRVEMHFMAGVVNLLAPGGVLLFVCPQSVAERYDFRKAWAVWFDDVAVWPFPYTCRRFNEVFVAGRLKPKWDSQPDVPYFEDMRRVPGVYELPAAPGPRKFEKTGLTEEELEDALAASPLNRFLGLQEAPGLARPPLALSVGHLALMLSSGQLDGLVCPPGERPHVVRGTAKKENEVTDQQVDKDRNGTKTTTVYTERIKLLVRAVDLDGIIHDLT